MNKEKENSQLLQRNLYIKRRKKSDIDDIHLITSCNDTNLTSYQERSLDDGSLAQITWHLIIQGQIHAAFIVQNTP